MNISNFVMFKLIHHQAVTIDTLSSLESGIADYGIYKCTCCVFFIPFRIELK